MDEYHVYFIALHFTYSLLQILTIYTKNVDIFLLNAGTLIF